MWSLYQPHSALVLSRAYNIIMMAGMLRVAYDDLTWAIFAQKRPGFTPATRAKLVTDAFAAAESGVQSWATTLSFLEFLDQETDLAPWDAALQGFGRMWTWIYPTGLQAKDPKQEDLSTPFKVSRIS